MVMSNPKRSGAGVLAVRRATGASGAPAPAVRRYPVRWPVSDLPESWDGEFDDMPIAMILDARSGPSRSLGNHLRI